MEKRERACDEEMLRLGSEPRVYAEAILNVCKLYVESSLACVSGVTGSDFKKRIEAIMTNRVALRLHFAKKAALAFAGMAALVAPIVVAMMKAPSIRAQSPQAKYGAAATPKFEVASIKPCKVDIAPGGKSGGKSSSPGRLNLECQTVKNLIQGAYVLFANGHVNLPGSGAAPIEGGPAWINSAHYQINAKAEGPQSQGTMHGPMLQTLLEDRFKLKIHRETREVPVYALTVAKGGLKLHQFKEGICTPIDFTIFTQFPPPPLPELPPGQKYCPNLGTMKGPNVAVEAQGTSLDEFSRFFLSRLDRPVINKTGITGLFDFHLEYAPDETTPLSHPDGGDPADPAGPSIFSALQQQLGLKLEPARGTREFLVVDHVEKPSAN